MFVFNPSNAFRITVLQGMSLRRPDFSSAFIKFQACNGIAPFDVMPVVIVSLFQHNPFTIYLQPP